MNNERVLGGAYAEKSYRRLDPTLHHAWETWMKKADGKAAIDGRVVIDGGKLTGRPGAGSFLKRSAR
jgi:hypothetical protein